ncbi:MAG: LuxR family transcriptional regulator [Pseudomonadota bacterium]
MSISLDQHFVGGRFYRDLLSLSDEADPLNGLKGLMSETADRLGYSYFAYHVVNSPALNGEDRRSTIGLTSYPEDWLQHYTDCGFVYHDPVVERVFQDNHAFRWNNIFKDRKFSKRQLEVMDDARDAGIFDGVTVPVCSRHGERASFTFVCSEDRSKKSPSPMVGVEQMVAEAFHGHALNHILCKEYQRSGRRKSSVLSPRETQVVTWAARGKSSWEMGQILGIAEKSVEFYIESAKRKLRAANRTHAAAKAIMLGLIDESAL